ncbi:hypothetical protein IJ556_07940 [bacterium]|nr:hypothetical protein [bacterium]
MAVPVFGQTGKKKVCIICEGFEEKEYLERLQSFGAWQGRYPGTDEVSFRKAQKDIGKYIFEDGEAEKVLHMS